MSSHSPETGCHGHHGNHSSQPLPKPGLVLPAGPSRPPSLQLSGDHSPLSGHSHPSTFYTLSSLPGPEQVEVWARRRARASQGSCRQGRWGAAVHHFHLDSPLPCCLHSWTSTESFQPHGWQPWNGPMLLSFSLNFLF